MDPMGNNLNNSPPTSDYKTTPNDWECLRPYGLTKTSHGKMNPKQDGSPKKYGQQQNLPN